MRDQKSLYRFVLLGIICIALNLRGPITAVGPVIELLKAQYSFSATTAGLITTLPLLAFAFFSPLVARFRYTQMMFYGLVCIALGELIRSYTGMMGVFAGTLIMGVGIAIANVLLPSVIKAKFPKKFGKVMALYSLILVVSATIGAGISVPVAISLHLGWANALALWVVIAILALLLWYPHLGGRRKYQRPTPSSNHSTAIYKSPTAWWITLFMGVQSLIFYSVVAWFPSILIARGYGLHFASNMTLLYQFCSIPVAFFAPMLIAKIQNKNRFFFIASLCAMYAFAFVILYFQSSPMMVFVATLLLAFPMGGVFGIALLFISMKASLPQNVAHLSGMAQSIGYLIAAIGPILLGFVYDFTESWKPSLVLFFLFALSLIFFAYKANSSKAI
ncbi:hypothetical protein BKH46_03845 [Helicobacter sp. 12S02634-8]|uniref:CynX/NimT family MFS transporter n=1 Tax=Helicobacter sp. 12S02634-8 TaxID=1476199 RepID=UPI000BA60E84|nr:MFS transporter [Helicobacter sp. 12S02634-8]PAF47567.1 hypothetical protein BKH46_03845 [Helicobacter sp. 12S02634-8]